MRQSKLIFSVVFLMMAVLTFSQTAIAGEGTASDYYMGAGKNIGRGLWNIASSPAEIPCTMNTEIKDRGATGVATGLGLGLGYFVRRVVVGASEILTFVLPSEATLPPVCQASESSTQAAVSK